MIIHLRYLFSNMWQLSKKYKLIDWISMFAGAFIFIFGYILGTMSWRIGTSGFFVMLNFTIGSVGFIYFCFKGLKIFFDASEELLALIYKEHAQLDMWDKGQSAQNYYVFGDSIYKRKQVSELEDSRMPSDVSQKDKFQVKAKDLPFTSNINEVEENDEETSGVKQLIYAEINSVRRNTLIFPNYENDITGGGIHIQRIDAVNGKRQESSDRMNTNSPAPRTQTEKQKCLETKNFSTDTENEIFQEHHLSNQSLDEHNFNEETCSSYQGNSSEIHPFSESYQSPATMRISSLNSFPEPSPRNVNSISQQHLSSSNENYHFPNKEQRKIRSSTSEYMLSSMQKDCMQHYEIPRTGSLNIDYRYDEDYSPPDPRRHLKPTKWLRKDLPPVPTPQNSGNTSEGSLYSPPLSQRLQFPVSTAVYQSDVPISNSLQSLLPSESSFQYAHTTAREYAPLSRQLSHPLILESCPFRTPQSRKCDPLIRLFSHPPNLETRLSSSRIQSPPPRPRPTPPHRTLINMYLHNLKVSPPSIPRKNKSFR